MQPIITIKDVSKTYKSGVQALKPLSLDIMRGEIFALLGPNGAGKTTLINMTCGIVNLSTGTIIADGNNIISDYKEARKKIGLVPQELHTDAFERVIDTVSFRQPLIRSLLGFNAYSEGWALYAQQIADELGVYDEFPVGRLGYLQSLAFRACRLVVDTGLHAKRWTREQGVEFFARENGSNPDDVRGEVDRYCSWPGQACGYKVGHSAINRLRTGAQSALGDRFDVRAFNDAVVTGGNVPMTVLGRTVDTYVAGARD